MSRGGKIGLILGVFLFMGLLVWLFNGSKEEPTTPDNKRTPFVSDNWVVRYQLDDKEPYGLYLFDLLTRTRVKNAEVRIIEEYKLFDTLVNKQVDPKTYLFVGADFGLEDDEIDTILQRIEDGSDLFISFGEFTENLYPRLLPDIRFSFEYEAVVNVFADSQVYQMVNVFQNDTLAGDWKTFVIDDSATHTTLSSFMEMSNFIRIPRGEGSIFLHANPEMFFNYQLKRNDGFAYTQFVLSHLKRNQDIYVLELGRLTDNYGNYDTGEEEGAGGKLDDSYLKEIFNSPPLLAAVLLSIAGLFLFVLFRSRRVRPVVPYLPERKNMTMAFAETITSIYFAKRNPYGLLQVQRKNFYTTVQKHFFVDLHRREDDKAIQMLAEKSNRRFDEIKDLLGVLESKEAFSVSEPYVAEVQRKIHAFYRSTGVISGEITLRAEKREMVFRRSMWLGIVLIKLGIFFITFGISMLMYSFGAGIILVPFGLQFLFLGIVRLSTPYMRVSGEDIVFYRFPFKNRSYTIAEIMSVEMRKRGVLFHFTDKRSQIINYLEMSSFDRKQFKNWLNKINTLKV